jgi:hypothetical protein
MRTLLAGAVALHTHIRLRMARLAGLQIPPRLRRVIRIPVVELRIGARLTVGLDLHVPLLTVLGMAIRTEFRLVAAIAVLRIPRRLHRMYRNKIGPVRAGLVFAPSRQTPRQIGLDPPTLMAIQAERLLVAFRAIVPRPLRQQPVLLHKKNAMIVNHSRTAVAILTRIKRGPLEPPVIRPGE